MDRLVPNLKARKANLIRRTRLRQALRTMLDQEDPVIAFIETWGLCVRVRYYLQEGEGHGLYGEHQPHAIDAWRQIEARIEQIGRQFLDEGAFAEARDNIHKFAQANPIRGTFANIVAYATEVKPGQPSPFDRIIALPMAPFSAMKGVDRTASAIYGMQGSMERISDIVEELPESAQWQLLLLLMEMEETEVVKTALTSMETFANSSVKFADAAEELPERLRQQVSILVEEIDTKQANLQATLEKAQETAVALEKTFSQAKETVEAAAQTANSIGETAQEWESAASATGELVQVVREWRTEAAKNKTSSATAVSDYKDTAQGVTDAATELRALVSDIRGLLDSKTLAAHIEDVDHRVLGVVAQTATEADDLTDHITWRLMQLVAVIFGFVLMYRFIAAYLAAKRK